MRECSINTECLHEENGGIRNITKTHTVHWCTTHNFWLLFLSLSLSPLCIPQCYLLVLFRFAYKFHNWSKLTCSSFFSRSLTRIATTRWVCFLFPDTLKKIFLFSSTFLFASERLFCFSVLSKNKNSLSSQFYFFFLIYDVTFDIYF